MPTDGKDINGGVVETVDQPVFLRDAPRPEAAQVMPQRFRFAQALAGIVRAQHVPDQLAQGPVQGLVALPQALVGFPGVAFKDQ